MENTFRTPITEDQVTLAVNNIGDLLWDKLHFQRDELIEDEELRLTEGFMYDMSLEYNVNWFKVEVLDSFHYPNDKNSTGLVEIKAINWLDEDNDEDDYSDIDFELPIVSLSFTDYGPQKEELNLVVVLRPSVREEHGVRVLKLSAEKFYAPAEGLHTRIPQQPESIYGPYEDYDAMMEAEIQRIMEKDD
jgi:hypothetical protein